MPVTISGDGGISGLGGLDGYDLQTQTLVVSGDTTIAPQAPGRATLFCDDSANSVGINTLTPNSSVFLEVADGTDPIVRVNNTGGGNLDIGSTTTAGYVRSSSGHELRLGSNAGDSIVLEADGDVNIDNNTLFVDVSANRVGITNNAPGALLEVGPANNSVQITGADLKFTRNTSYLQHTGTTTLRFRDRDNNNYITFDYNSGSNRLSFGSVDYTTFFTDGTSRMRILANGNIGIGTDTPQQKLQLGSTTATDQRLSIFSSTSANNDAYGSIDFRHGLPNGNINCKISALRSGGTSGGGLAFFTRQQGDATNTDGGEERMRISPNGAVGIGLPNPGAKLEVGGDVNKTFPQPINLKLTNNDDAPDAGVGTGISFRARWSDNASQIADYAVISGIKENNTVGNYAGALVFGTRVNGSGASSLERMRINSNGSLLIGQPSETLFDNSLTADVNARLQVCGTSENASSGTFVFYGGGASGQRVASIALGRSRGSAAGTYTVVNSGDKLGEISFHGASGTKLLQGARIAGLCVGTPGTSSMPGVLTFSTTADGANSPTERMRIRSDGNVSIGDGGTEYQKLGINGSFPTAGVNKTEILSVRGNFRETVSNAWVYLSRPNVNLSTSAEFLGNLGHFCTDARTTLTQGTITNQYGFICGSSLTAATNNYGFYSNIASATGRWNFYANGDAKNYFAGDVFFASNNATGIDAGTVNGKRLIGSNGILNSSRNVTTEIAHHQFRNPNGLVGGITTTGSATSYNTASDYRLKENVVDLTGAIDRVNQLRVRRFNFIADPSVTVDGFLAHEAQTVVPEAVTGEKDGEEMQAIDTSKLVPLLTAALQESIARIDELQKEVNALKSNQVN